MKRTRKWVHVAQEAGRLAALGMSQKDIAATLGVNVSTVWRWVTKGKLAGSRKRQPRESTAAPPPTPPKTPDEWAKDVRATYDLDATDDQLVTVAQSSLELSLDKNAAPQLRLQAAGRFQALVKQLALITRLSEQTQPAAPVKEPKSPLRVVRRDPRHSFMAANE